MKNTNTSPVSTTTMIQGHHEAAGEGLLREADDQSGEQPGRDDGEPGLAVVDAEQVEHVEQQHGDDRDPHPSSTTDRLGAEEFAQPSDREGEDHQDDSGQQDGERGGEEDVLGASGRAPDAAEQRADDEHRDALIDRVVDGGEDERLPPAAAIPEALQPVTWGEGPFCVVVGRA